MPSGDSHVPPALCVLLSNNKQIIPIVLADRITAQEKISVYGHEINSKFRYFQ